MSRRNRPEAEENNRSDRNEEEQQRKGRLEGVIPDLIKKAVLGGYDKASEAQESIKNFITESKLPKEIVSAFLNQLDDTKNGLFRVVAKEIRGFLEAVDFQKELQKLLTTVSFEIRTEIRFIPNDAQPEKLGRPDVKAAMKVKRQEKQEKPEDGKRGKKAAKESELADVGESEGSQEESEEKNYPAKPPGAH